MPALLEPGANRCLFGIRHSGTALPDPRETELTTALGSTYRFDVLHNYWAWTDNWVGSWLDTMSAQRPAGGAVMISWNGLAAPFLTDINNGVYDATIDARATAIAAKSYSVFLRPWYEMNLTSSPWCGAYYGNTTTAFKNAWIRLFTRFRNAGADNVAFVWCPGAVDVPRARPTDAGAWNHWTNYYPGDAYVDWVGADAYNWSDRPNGDGVWHTAEDILINSNYGTGQSVYADYPTKPFMWSEFGTVGDAGPTANPSNDKRDWFRSARDRLKSYPRVKAVVYFDTPHSTSDPAQADWRVDRAQSTTPASPVDLNTYQGYKDWAFNAYYMGGEATSPAGTVRPSAATIGSSNEKYGAIKFGQPPPKPGGATTATGGLNAKYGRLKYGFAAATAPLAPAAEPPAAQASASAPPVAARVAPVSPAANSQAGASAPVPTVSVAPSVAAASASAAGPTSTAQVYVAKLGSRAAKIGRLKLGGIGVVAGAPVTVTSVPAAATAAGIAVSAINAPAPPAAAASLATVAPAPALTGTAVVPGSATAAAVAAIPENNPAISAAAVRADAAPVLVTADSVTTAVPAAAAATAPAAAVFAAVTAGAATATSAAPQARAGPGAPAAAATISAPSVIAVAAPAAPAATAQAAEPAPAPTHAPAAPAANANAAAAAAAPSPAPVATAASTAAAGIPPASATSATAPTAVVTAGANIPAMASAIPSGKPGNKGARYAQLRLGSATATVQDNDALAPPAAATATAPAPAAVIALETTPAATTLSADPAPTPTITPATPVAAATATSPAPTPTYTGNVAAAAAPASAVAPVSAAATATVAGNTSAAGPPVVVNASVPVAAGAATSSSANVTATHTLQTVAAAVTVSYVPPSPTTAGAIPAASTLAAGLPNITTPLNVLVEARAVNASSDAAAILIQVTVNYGNATVSAAASSPAWASVTPTANTSATANPPTVIYRPPQQLLGATITVSTGQTAAVTVRERLVVTAS